MANVFHVWSPRGIAESIREHANANDLHGEDLTEYITDRLSEWRETIRLTTGAYLLDRGDQYETDSPCWIALADCAEGVVNDEPDDAARHGEYEPELFVRVSSMVGRR
jgi:hypothetical protein